MSALVLVVFATALVLIMLVAVTLVICQLEPGLLHRQGRRRTILLGEIRAATQASLFSAVAA